MLLHCFAGCSNPSILHKIGLKLSDLFVNQPGTSRPSQRVAEYGYFDVVTGALVAQKVRMQPKKFFWQHQNGTGKWKSGFGDDKPGLYRLPELIEERRVFYCEGEKSVNRLRSVGLPATCAPYGADTWLPEWSVNLWEVGVRDLVILPDADGPGRKHAEKVAALTYKVALAHPDDLIRVKVVSLPELQGGADVFDWLDIGHEPLDLVFVAQEAAYWFPGIIEAARLDRKRMKDRERSRRYRERRRVARTLRHGVNVQAEWMERHARHAVTHCERTSNTLQDQYKGKNSTKKEQSNTGFRTGRAYRCRSFTAINRFVKSSYFYLPQPAGHDGTLTGHRGTSSGKQKRLRRFQINLRSDLVTAVGQISAKSEAPEGSASLQRTS